MAVEVESGVAWIFEGGFSMTHDRCLSCADTLIWPDLPVGLRPWRETKRLLRCRGGQRPDMATGCVERIRSERLALCRGNRAARQCGRARIAALPGTAPDHVAVFHLCGRQAVRRFPEKSPC